MLHGKSKQNWTKDVRNPNNCIHQYYTSILSSERSRVTFVDVDDVKRYLQSPRNYRLAHFAPVRSILGLVAEREERLRVRPCLRPFFVVGADFWHGVETKTRFGLKLAQWLDAKIDRCKEPYESERSAWSLKMIVDLFRIILGP